MTLTVSDSDGRSAMRALPVTVVVAPAGGGSPGGSPAPSPGVAPQAKRCRVSHLRGLTLTSARRRLKAANCALGKVRSPHTHRRLVVRSSSPPAGVSLKLGARVNLRLTVAPARRHHHR